MLPLLKAQVIIPHIDTNHFTRLDVATKNGLRQRIFEMTLNRTTQRTRAVFRVVSLFDQKWWTQRMLKRVPSGRFSALDST